MPWLVLALVFVDELLLVAAAAVWGNHAGGWSLAVATALVTVALWAAFASPRAPYGGDRVRPTVQVVLFVLGSAGLLTVGHPRAALALLAFSIVVHAAAQLPSVLALRRQIQVTDDQVQHP